GVVEAVGNNVESFKPGDEVFGGGPGHAEFACVSEDGPLAIKPENLSFEEAAAVSYGTLTALPFLRDSGNIQSGQKVLINGASGSIGSYAVQIAKYYGAEVTGVCSTANVELVKSLGASKVIDYKKEDFTKSKETWDIIFDVVGKSSYSKSKRALTSNGIFMTTVMGLPILFHMLWTSKFGSKKANITFTGLRPPEEMAKDLLVSKKLVEQGIIKPVIDRTWPLEDIIDATRYVEKGHKRGNVVITLV
ncbi:MAG: NAD(P)-dependent alcohol dehydrogenase, partial [Balneolaceae bacterium]|nr:NAD(P)-dependent alcohol dehydrogenase [Balneolaceae bacterium]